MQSISSFSKLLSSKLHHYKSFPSKYIRFYQSSNSSLDGTNTRQMHGTTVLCVRKDNKVCLIADGQVTLGHAVVKPNAKKLREIGNSGVIAGFAGSTADAITLFERLEAKLEEHPGQLARACVELTKLWRTDKYLRKLEAVMIVADKDVSLMLSGEGDVLEPPAHGVLAIGSGGNFAQSAALALIDVPGYDPETICKKAMKIAADTCIYTNANFTMLKIEDSKVINVEKVE